MVVRQFLIHSSKAAARDGRCVANPNALFVGHQLVQHDRQRLSGFRRQNYLRAFDPCAALSRAERELFVIEFCEAHTLPVTPAEQPVSIGHRLNAGVKHLQELVRRDRSLTPSPRSVKIYLDADDGDNP